MFVLGCYRLISWNTFSDLTFQFCCCPSIGSISNPSWSKFMLLWQKALKICWTIHVCVLDLVPSLRLWDKWKSSTLSVEMSKIWRLGSSEDPLSFDLAKSHGFGLSENCLHFSEWKSWRPAASLGTWLCGLQIVEPLTWNPDRIPSSWSSSPWRRLLLIIIAMILITILAIIIAMIRHTV